MTISKVATFRKRAFVQMRAVTPFNGQIDASNVRKVIGAFIQPILSMRLVENANTPNRRDRISSG
jgi:hypothetical protein